MAAAAPRAQIAVNKAMHLFIRKLNTARRLPMDQWIILIKGWFMMLYVRLRMDFTPFRGWRHWLIQPPVETFKPLNDSEKSTIVTCRRMVNLASRYHLINANCLPKSLTLKWMLENQGIECELKVGLNPQSRDFQGHAWLQRDEIVLNDSHDVATRYPVKQELSQKPPNIQEI